MNSELKVGDKFIDIKNKRQIVEVLALTNRRIIYGEATGWQDGNYIESFLKHYTPYQEPVLVKRIVAMELNDEIRLVREYSKIEEKLNDYGYKRIELSPELFFGGVR